MTTLLLLALAAAAPARPASAPAREPLHVLFIVLDAARADHLSCCGYPKPTTPRLDELARRGAVFRNCFAPETRTDLAVSRILSSRHLSVPVVPYVGTVFGTRRETPKTLMRRHDDGQIFLPELFGQNGYRTAIFTDHPWITPEARLPQMFEDIFFRGAEPDGAEALIGQAAAWLERMGGEPAFAYIHLLCPHFPSREGPEDKVFLPHLPPEALARLRRKVETQRGTGSGGWSPEELTGLVGLYDANLRRADRLVGTLLDRVRGEGRAARTLVLVTADHAENIGEHGELHHLGPPWDSVTRVPLILALPGDVPAGRVVDDDVSSLDIMPTLVALSGAKLPPGKTLDGESLLPVLRRARPARPYVLADRYLRADGFKYISSPEHLADVRRDPGETRDLSVSEPGSLARMRSRHAELMEPYRRRAQTAVRSAPPVYAFHFPMPTFSISPASAVAREGPVPQESRGPPACWILRQEWKDPILFRSRECRGDAPIELAVPLPTGTYRASVVVECAGADSAAASAFEFRPSAESVYQPCLSSPGAGRYGSQRVFGRSLVWCPLGEVSVTGGLFRFWARAQPPAGGPCGLRHVVFAPPGDHPASGPDLDRPRESLERMRKAGYW